MNRFSLALLGALGLTACGVEQARPSSQVQAMDIDNGRELNGRELNGRELNGRELNGRELNGASLDSLRITGADLGATWLDGAELKAAAADGHTLAGADLVGATLNGTANGGDPVSLRIVGVVPDPEAPDVPTYLVEYARGHDWQPLCGTDGSGAPVAALALAGRWLYRQGPHGGDHVDEPGTVTFACRGFALAKCTELGYRPWATAQRCSGGTCAPYALAAYHQACTRMLRADYCGDGRSFTQDGTLINVYDDLGIQGDAEAWAFEAEWTADGARCISRTRLALHRAPDCVDALRSSTCGDPVDFARGALLMDEDAH